MYMCSPLAYTHLESQEPVVIQVFRANTVYRNWKMMLLKLLMAYDLNVYVYLMIWLT